MCSSDIAGSPHSICTSLLFAASGTSANSTLSSSGAFLSRFLSGISDSSKDCCETSATAFNDISCRAVSTCFSGSTRSGITSVAGTYCESASTCSKSTAFSGTAGAISGFSDAFSWSCFEACNFAYASSKDMPSASALIAASASIEIGISFSFIHFASSISSGFNFLGRLEHSSIY